MCCCFRAARLLFLEAIWCSGVCSKPPVFKPFLGRLAAHLGGDRVLVLVRPFFFVDMPLVGVAKLYKLNYKLRF